MRLGLLRPHLSRLGSEGRSCSMYTLANSDKPSLVIGVRQHQSEESFTLTSTGEKMNNLCNGEISARLCQTGSILKAGASRLLGSVHPDYGPVVAVGLGKHNDTLNTEENIELNREAVRGAAAAGIRAVKQLGLKCGQVECFDDSEAAAEGATLANWSFTKFKAEKDPLPSLLPLDESAEWNRGCLLGGAQNLARELMEFPANHLTPRLFAEQVINQMQGLPVEIIVRDEAWAESMKMGSFMSVAAGSAEPLRFLEMSYKGGDKDTPPVVLVGKGVTFDTGGISLKPSSKMDKMRADMGGAATVTATLKAVAELALPVNMVVLVPLTENMPGIYALSLFNNKFVMQICTVTYLPRYNKCINEIGGKATKPGDVVTAMNGKTIQIDNTDAEGRLILADALTYADSFDPRLVMDVATLTGAISVALGTAATGAYATSTQDFKVLEAAGCATGDRVWRMPLWNHYTKLMKKSPLADLNNISLSPGGGSCTAAAFLKEFTTSKNWLHLDIAGVMENEGAVPYLGSGMSGRPTRTMIKFVETI